jgi:hypothetical protein
MPDVTGQLVAALVAAREFIADEIDVLLRCHCTIGDDDEPIRSTMDPGDAEIIARDERLLAAVDAAIAAGDAALGLDDADAT